MGFPGGVNYINACIPGGVTLDINKILGTIDAFFAEKRTEDAKEYIIKTLAVAKESKRYDIYIPLCNELAGIYRVSGEKESCCKILDGALQILEENNLTKELSYATTLLNLATAYSAFGNTQNALKTYAVVEEYYNANLYPFDYRFASLYNNMCFALLKTGEEEKGLSYSEKSLTILQTLKGTEVEQATCHTNIGQIETSMNRLDKAFYHLACADKIFNENQIFDVHYDALLSAFGNLKYKQMQYREAAEYYEKAAERIKAKFGRNSNYRLLCRNCIKALAKIGDTQKIMFFEKEINQND